MELNKNIDFAQYKNYVAVTLICGILFFSTKSLLSYYAEKNKKLDKEIKAVEQKKKVLDKWEKYTVNFEKEAEKFFRKDVMIFRKFLEESAENNGISITSLRTSRKDQRVYWESSIDLKMSCFFDQFVSFIKTIETKSLEIVKVRIGKDKQKIKIDLLVKGIILKK